MRGCLGGSWNAAANHAHSNTCCCRPPHTNHRRLRSGGHPSNVLGQIGSRQPAAATAHQRWSVQASVTTAAAAANNSAAEAAAASSTTSKRVVWVQTTNQAVLTAAVESGVSHILSTPATQALVQQWQELATFETLSLQPDGTITDASSQQVGRLQVVSSKQDLQAAEAAAKQPGFFVMDATDWKVIPAENLVAAFQPGPGRLMGVASSAADARVMLEALEAGTAGVLLRTDDPLQVKQLAAYLTQREAEGEPTFKYARATVTKVTPVGMGDRVCVDLCSLLRPGEGMLVGSFARALFLVHSECMESQYINSRPFRVNAGAVHAYVQAPDGKTAYLSELRSGSEVLVADAAGRTRTAVVGRCKVEVRPMMLIEAETSDGLRHSTLLQNAETVRLVCPADGGGCSVGSSSSSSSSGSSSISSSSGSSSISSKSSQHSWQAVSVSSLQPGQSVFLLLQKGARHTGISIQEQIKEC